MDDTSEGGRKFGEETCVVLSELRECGQLCDAIIKVENVDFLVHRVIMAACSPYFRALFTNKLFDLNKQVVVIPGVSPDIMKMIIEYAYTQKVLITTKNVEKLLPAADQFHVNGLVKACCDVFASQLSCENAIGIRKFSRAYFCHTLERTAQKFLMQNFCDIYPVSKEYLEMNIDDLCKILLSDELNVRNEELVFDAVVCWINFDHEQRKRHITRLLLTIRLGLLTTQFFVEKVKTHPYVRDNEACKPIIIDTLKFLYDLELEDGNLEFSNPISRPRVPHEILFITGGWSDGAPVNAMETYDARADKWITCQHVDTIPRAYHGTTSLNSLIYVIGGLDGTEYLNSVRCFDPSNARWVEVAPMNIRRCYVSVTTVENCIYAIGGYDGHNRQDTSEKYTPSTNQWSLIAPMNKKRSDASASSLKGKIYVCGGYNGQECLNSAECYDPIADQWMMLAPMRNCRSGLGIVGYQDYIYALGGFNGITRMNTGEKYSPVTNSWHHIPEMYNPRSNFALQVIDDMIFVIGGFNGVTTIFHVECYDGDTDDWYSATDMNKYRSALSACVVKDLPNVYDYIYKGPSEEDLQEDDDDNDVEF